MQDEDFENIDSGPCLQIIPPGYYLADCVEYTSRVYGDTWGERLILAWKIYRSFSPVQTVELTGYYTIRRNPAGRIKVGDRHAYRRDWIKVNHGRHPNRRDSLPISKFKEGRLLVAVVTVTQDSKKQPLHPSCQYSKVADVVRPIQDGDSLKTFPL